MRPRIHPTPTSGDRILETISLILLALLWASAIYYYPLLPDQVPIHMDWTGQVDNYGQKHCVFIDPIMGTVLYILLTILNRFPWLFSSMEEITIDNALPLYSIGTHFMRAMKCVIVFIVLTFQMGMILFSMYGNDTIQLMSPFIAVGLIVGCIYYLFYLNKAKRMEV